MSLSAHYKQIAQGVLSAESGTHECQSAGAIPTHPSQTDLILASKIATFYVFFPKTELIGRVGTKLSIQLLILAQMLGEL